MITFCEAAVDREMWTTAQGLVKMEVFLFNNWENEKLKLNLALENVWTSLLNSDLNRKWKLKHLIAIHILFDLEKFTESLQHFTDEREILLFPLW